MSRICHRISYQCSMVSYGERQNKHSFFQMTRIVILPLRGKHIRQRGDFSDVQRQIATEPPTPRRESRLHSGNQTPNSILFREINPFQFKALSTVRSALLGDERPSGRIRWALR